MKLHEKVAQAIESEILLDPLKEIPSVRQLAKKFDVSTKTICEAIKVLKDQQKVLTRAGRKITRIGLDTSLEKNKDAAGNLFIEIKSDILDGKLRVNEAMPKQDFFAISHHIGRDTVRECFSRLKQENLIHKIGRQWFAGPMARSLEREQALKSSNWPVVIVLVRTDTSWYELFDNPHTGSFMASFKNELGQHGVQLFLVQREHSDKQYSPAPEGIDALMSTIRQLGSRYRGGLICDIDPDLQEIRLWSRALSCNGKFPVAFFDQTDTGKECTRTGLSLAANYFRFYFDEFFAVKTAVSCLVENGHRVIGLPTTTEWNTHWALRRLEIAGKVAQAHPAQPEIVTTQLTEPFWKSQFSLPEEERFGSWFAQIHKHAQVFPNNRTVPRSSSQQVIIATPSMKPLLDRNVTALISLNDWLAQSFYLWLRAAGIEIPRQMSVISFDNIPESVVLPITTIDFGLSRLGYLAAHALIRDIAINADREGNVAGNCTVINRGSVAALPGSTQ